MKEYQTSTTWITQSTKEEAEETAKLWHESLQSIGYTMDTVKVYRKFLLWGDWVVKMIHKRPE